MWLQALVTVSNLLGGKSHTHSDRPAEPSRQYQAAAGLETEMIPACLPPVGSVTWCLLGALVLNMGHIHMYIVIENRVNNCVPRCPLLFSFVIKNICIINVIVYLLFVS